ncbi:MAG: YGL010W-like membrane protein [Oleispira sp.]|jgi:uncharacterized membrane protein YGL010W
MNEKSRIDMSKKTPDQWFNEYGDSHQNKTNKLIHWICVPLIFLVILGLVWAIPVPAAFSEIHPYLNWATLAFLFIAVFYIRLSPKLAIGLIIFSLSCYGIIAWYESLQVASLALTCTVLFVILWILQFIGHNIEGKKPSFFKDVQFLMIGPAWLMGFIYRRLGLSY